MTAESVLNVEQPWKSIIVVGSDNEKEVSEETARRAAQDDEWYRLLNRESGDYALMAGLPPHHYKPHRH